MRNIIVAGNWKMNKDFNQAKSLYLTVLEKYEDSNKLDRILIFPSFPYLVPLEELAKRDKLALGSQNIASEETGAYTGEVSASMIASLGVMYTLIGHSERRTLFGEDHATLKKKVDQALLHKLHPVFCCGEVLVERQQGKQEEVIERQLKESLFHLSENEMRGVIIAYEPVWAIGTGETASSEQAQDMHAFIRKLLSVNYNQDLADHTHILYGGSCKASNSTELFAMPDVDGGLIGGASLNADEFLKIISQLNG